MERQIYHVFQAARESLFPVEDETAVILTNTKGYATMEWEESKHPRDSDGRFSKVGSESERDNLIIEIEDEKPTVIEPSHVLVKINLDFFAEKDIANQSSNSLKRALRKYRANILLHEDKISHPMRHFPDWNSYDERYKRGLIRKWRKEIENFSVSISDRIEELKKRGDYNDE